MLWVGWWPSDSPSPKNWVFRFFRLGLHLGPPLGPVGTGDQDLDLGLIIFLSTSEACQI